MTQRDWRLPANRREAFQRSYSFSLKYGTFPGCVYALLPAIADAMDLEDDGRAWLAWLNGNTQNAVTSLLLLEAAPTAWEWRKAVDFWNDNFTKLEWDTDRRHQKSKFGEATEQWIRYLIDMGDTPSSAWYEASRSGWKSAWSYAKSLPHFGRLSAWSGLEFARILLGADVIPDMGSWLLDDKSGSRSHRNGLGLIAGYDATYWDADTAEMLGVVEELEELAESLLREAYGRNTVTDGNEYLIETRVHPWVSRLTMESALCTYKSWWKPNRRYPNVYADMMYQRIKKAEARFGRRLDLLWDARKKHLPEWLRLEDNPYDPGLSLAKQNHYRETGEIPLLFDDWEDMEQSQFDINVVQHKYGERKDPKW